MNPNRTIFRPLALILAALILMSARSIVPGSALDAAVQTTRSGDPNPADGVVALPMVVSAAQGYSPADPNLAPYARTILNRFVQYKGQYWLSGQQEVHWDAARQDEMSNAVYAATNPPQYPGVRGWDAPFGSSGAADAEWMIDTIISDWTSAQVLPTISQHWTPTGSQGSVHADMFVAVNINNIFTNGTPERERYLAWRTHVAADLQQLEDASVPVLWRPFHEAGGGWFWWDKDGGPTGYKRLWNDLWDYLVNTQGLHNLIWVWSPGVRGVATDWYPAGTVDILGSDIYDVSSADYTSWYSDLGRFSATRLRALTEVDYMMDPAALDAAPFAYFMVWHTGMFYRNSASTVNSVYQHPRTIARGRMSQFINGSLSGGGSTPTPTPPPSISTLYNFEAGNLEGWSASGVSAGPWPVSEWAANGSYSLKADVDLGSRQTALKITLNQDLSGKTRLQAQVKHAPWGTMGSGMTAKLYLMTGAGWAWFDGGVMLINGTSATVLNLDLSGVSDLSQVRELGVEFSSPASSSGTSAIYVDYVTVMP